MFVDIFVLFKIEHNVLPLRSFELIRGIYPRDPNQRGAGNCEGVHQAAD